MQKTVHIIGGGLAGCEAAFQLAERNVKTILYEMRPDRTTPAHKSSGLAELVCSNSLRSGDYTASAVGLLHEELRRAGSVLMRIADETKVPAGGALAVDRDLFSKRTQEEIEKRPQITVRREEITDIARFDDDSVIVASGPLTSDALAKNIAELTGQKSLYFFDAIAPIVEASSIDMDKAFFQSRYDKGDGADYINCPLSREEYQAFVKALVEGEKIPFKDFEKEVYFEGCLPIEVMAARGERTLSFGPLKPVGLTDPRTGKRPTAVVQLRAENRQKTLYNLVGFQTKLSHKAQPGVFRMIPGLENAVFARLGGIHRNTFIHSPSLLDPSLRLLKKPSVRFAGQITGCEGYVESMGIGFLAGLFAASEISGKAVPAPPEETAIGALLAHITKNANPETFQPMNVNFGLFKDLPESAEEPLPGKKKKKIRGGEKKMLLSERALQYLSEWLPSIKDET